MSTHDLCLGMAAILVFTDADAAQRVADAVEAEREYLFQADGLGVSVRQDTGRDIDPHAEDEDEDPEEAFRDLVHGRKVPEVVAMIRAAQDSEAVDRIRTAERDNPRPQGPRQGILDECDERDEALTEGGD